jgi:endonuclease YncB( thermonuclease family)
MPDNYTRRFTVARVIDGDTLVAGVIDLGYHTAATPGVEYRFLRVNCPETNRPASRPAGLVAKAFTVDWIAQHAAHDPEGWLYATSQKTDSFGRYLAEIECAAGHNLSDALLISGNAVPYP